jgi:DNA-binding NarL/FixJ family response regulator
MKARLFVGVIAGLTAVANLWLGVGPVKAVLAGVAVAAVGEVAGRLVRSRPLPNTIATAESAVPAAGAHPLSPREFEVAVLLAQGLTSKEVARRLFIEKGTVDKHWEHIKDKLNIDSRPQLAIWLMERGLLQPAGAAK